MGKGNKSLKKAFGMASEVASNPDLIADLIRDVTGKMGDIDDSKRKVSDFLDKVRTFVRMLTSYINGDYREIPWKSLLLLIGALIYFIMPIDLIPDFIPASGLLDDISVVLLVFNGINEDINAFLEYEKSKKEK
jgi:uncharacterized membrane protein YkvA (DUF1232 family)